MEWGIIIRTTPYSVQRGHLPALEGYWIYSLGDADYQSGIAASASRGVIEDMSDSWEVISFSHTISFVDSRWKFNESSC